MKIRVLFVSLLIGAAGTSPLLAWNYEGHRMVNQLALSSLPEDFPDFVHQPDNAERIAFLAGEADRWRNNPALPLKHYNGLDHYFDAEQLASSGLSTDSVSDLRYSFAVEFAKGRLAHPENFPEIDSDKNQDNTKEWPGFLPWAITEYYGKLKSAFSYLKTFQKAGTTEEVSNAQANVLYLMGVMGHYVGDGAQPLHTTIHHNGWSGDNPERYTRWGGIHSWIDGGFIAKAEITTEKLLRQVTPVRAFELEEQSDGRDPLFVAAMNYLMAQNAQVVPFYKMEKDDRFKAAQVSEDPSGREFIEGQLLRGGEMLGAIWQTAWENATDDSYLTKQLAKRAAANEMPLKAD